MDQRTSLAGAAVERSVVALAPPSCLEPRRLSLRRSMRIRPPDQPIVARTFGVLALVVIASTTASPISLTAQRPSSFARFVDAYLDRFAQYHPSIAAGNGIHVSDGRLEDFSPSSIAAEITWLRDDAASAGHVRPRATDARRTRRPPDSAGHRRRLAARSRHRPHLDAQPDDLRRGDLRRRPQPDDDGVVAGGGAAEAGGRQAARRAVAARGRARRTSGRRRACSSTRGDHVSRRCRICSSTISRWRSRMCPTRRCKVACGGGRPRRAARSMAIRASSRPRRCRRRRAATRSARPTSRRATAPRN